MSANYTGNAANVTTPLAASAIQTLDPTISLPFTIVTAAPHNFNTGDLVYIEAGLGGGVPLGVYQITVGSASQFSLDGTSGYGSGTTSYGGVTVYNVSLTPSITRPSDGDLRTAASLRIAVDGLSDRSQFLVNRMVVQPPVWEFTSGTFVVPKTGLYEITCIGGGGGGGGGSPGNTDGGGSGAGGGAGSTSTNIVACTIGDGLVLAGGAGGTAGTAGTFAGLVNGGDGGDGGTITVTNPASAVIAKAFGGGGGAGGLSYSGGSTRYAAGGLAGIPGLSRGASFTTSATSAPIACGSGGYGRGIVVGSSPISDAAVQPGGRGTAGSGGAAGVQGSSASGTAGGGGGGGGGGGSDWLGGNGGAGGAGGNGSATNPAPAGSAGSAGTLGSGGGGGGGGAKTSTAISAVHGDGGAGGVGGAGKVRFKYLGRVTL